MRRFALVRRVHQSNSVRHSSRYDECVAVLWLKRALVNQVPPVGTMYTQEGLVPMAKAQGEIVAIKTMTETKILALLNDSYFLAPSPSLGQRAQGF